MLFTTGVKDRLLKVLHISVRTATKRASGGKSANNNTAGRRLGPKKGEGQFVEAGQIVWRQRGTVWYPGENAGIGRDHTIYAREPGYVRFYRDPFHAKRKFIGIALGSTERLPTPHFSPRRRRFGRTLIDNPEIAEFEKQYISKKETELQLVRQAQLESRAKSRTERLEKYATDLHRLVPELTPEEVGFQASRFNSIFQYVKGGWSFTEARDIVDKHNSEDLALDLKCGRIVQEQFDSQTSDYSTMRAKVDQKVMIGANMELVQFLDTESLSKARSAAISHFRELTKNVDLVNGTPDDVRAQIEAKLEDPIFDEGLARKLKKQFILRPRPVQISNSDRKDYEKLVQKGQGEFKKVWDDSSRRIREYYVPHGAALIF